MKWLLCFCVPNDPVSAPTHTSRGQPNPSWNTSGWAKGHPALPSCCASLPLVAAHGIYSLLQSTSLLHLEESRASGTSSKVCDGICWWRYTAVQGWGPGRSCPHIVFTPGRTHNISKSRLAPNRAVLPRKRQERHTKNKN